MRVFNYIFKFGEVIVFVYSFYYDCGIIVVDLYIVVVILLKFFLGRCWDFRDEWMFVWGIFMCIEFVGLLFWIVCFIYIFWFVKLCYF